MERNKEGQLSIYIQAVIAVMLIQLVHKIVREIPGSIRLMEAGGPKMGPIVVTILTVMLALGIILSIFRKNGGFSLALFLLVG